MSIKKQGVKARHSWLSWQSEPEQRRYWCL